MADLFPVSEFDITDIEAPFTRNQTEYKKSISYDISSAQVLRDGQNKVLTANGIDAWKQWCFNALNTERFSCAAYPAWYGIETQRIREAQTREEAEAELTAQVTETLLSDPLKRTKYVSSINFNWVTPDGLEVDIIIQGTDDASIDITIPITL